MRGALSFVIWFSSAAGIRMSTSRPKRSSLPSGSRSESGHRLVLPDVLAELGDLQSLGVVDPPFQSVTATTLAPSSARSSALIDPTLPKPWTATVALLISMPTCLADSRVTIITPRPVASRRPSDPPSSTGFPVTTPGLGVADMHAVGVHHPRHRLLVGVHVVALARPSSGPMESMISAT